MDFAYADTAELVLEPKKSAVKILKHTQHSSFISASL